MNLPANQQDKNPSSKFAFENITERSKLKSIETQTDDRFHNEASVEAKTDCRNKLTNYNVSI